MEKPLTASYLPAWPSLWQRWLVLARDKFFIFNLWKMRINTVRPVRSHPLLSCSQFAVTAPCQSVKKWELSIQQSSSFSFHKALCKWCVWARLQLYIFTLVSEEELPGAISKSSRSSNWKMESIMCGQQHALIFIYFFYFREYMRI